MAKEKPKEEVKKIVLPDVAEYKKLQAEQHERLAKKEKVTNGS